ncbi:hypothetical protein ACFSSA_06345 [Luteolibacter algae]|uniref:SGNH/GDSL hydrolase family protein n=1 Tax=Luteolibacter algae TaxID=454151 RepID=A0ABW5D6D4_9BACT
MTKPTRERDIFFCRLMMFARLLSFLGLSSCATLPPVTGESGRLREKAAGKDLEILFIGNSYSFGIPAAFSKLARDNGKKVRIGHSTYGGWSLARHMGNAPTLKKLRSRDWDIVVIQDYSLNPSRKERERRKLMDPGVRFFAGEARSRGAIPLLYQTWGRRDGNPELPGDDFYQMTQRVRDGYRAASRNGGGIIIVPAGDAWERQFKAGRGQELFVEDGSHPSAFGNEITAREFYKVIYGNEPE